MSDQDHRPLQEIAKRCRQIEEQLRNSPDLGDRPFLSSSSEIADRLQSLEVQMAILAGFVAELTIYVELIRVRVGAP
jgi:hypothetical protein